MTIFLAAEEVPETDGTLYAITPRQIVEFSETVFHKSTAHLNKLSDRINALEKEGAGNFEKARAHFDICHYRRHMNLLDQGFSWSDMVELASCHGEHIPGKPDISKKIVRKIGIRNLPMYAGLANAYVTEVNRNHWLKRDELTATQDKEKRHKAFIDHWSRLQLDVAKYLQTSYADIPIPISYEALEKTLQELKPGEAGYELIAVHLLSCFRGTHDGSYDAGRILLDLLPSESAEVATALLVPLMDIEDTHDLFWRKDSIIRTCRIPDAFAPAFNEKLLYGTQGRLSPRTSKIDLLMPPRSHPLGQDFLRVLVILAHELRHNGRHYNNPELPHWPHAHSTDDEFTAKVKRLMFVKVSEADAFVFQTAVAFHFCQLRWEAGEKNPEHLLHDSVQRDLTFFTESLIRHRETASDQDAYKAALRDVFISKLHGLEEYEHAYADCTKDPRFIDCWNENISTVDMEWFGKMTRMKNLGDEPYIDNTRENADAIKNGLGSTARRHAPGHAPVWPVFLRKDDRPCPVEARFA